MKIETGSPKKKGTYVLYINSGASSHPEKKLFIWDGYVWVYPSSIQSYKGIVYGWIGPLPLPKIDNLRYNKKKYAITNEMGREFDSYKQGVFNSLEKAFECVADEGDFIWELNVDGRKKAVGKWSNKKNKWLKKNKCLKSLRKESQ